MNRSKIIAMCVAACVSPALASAETVNDYPTASAKQPNNSTNPQISVILDGGYSSYSYSEGEAVLPGFFLGGEAGLAEEGFALGHSEIVASANIDQHFFGKITAAIAEHDGETELELEEAFIETVGLGSGITVRGGRMFSAVGYLNQQHQHAWDFVDAPLIYRGLWGRNYIDDGLRVSWIAPTNTFLEIGGEILSGYGFPASKGEGSQLRSQVLFANLGGDFDASNAWQAGLSFHNAKVTDREAGGHEHGGGGGEEVPAFSGDSHTIGANFIYKWAPNGNYKYQHVKVQAEFFARSEDGDVELEGSMPLEESTVDLKQRGFYLQGVYQFAPHWRAGMRYDRVSSSVSGDDPSVLDEAGLETDHNPWRGTASIEWVPSEFSRIRVQYNHDRSVDRPDNQWFVQYTYSLGAHGAHTF